MKKLLTAFVLLFFISLNVAIHAHEIRETPERWFIQVGAFTSLDNAVNEKKYIENILAKTFDAAKYDDPDIVYGNHVFLFEKDNIYRAYIGAYPTQEYAEDILNKLPALTVNPYIVSLKENYYNDFAQNYRFTLNEISKDNYEKAIAQLFLTKEGVNSFSPNLFVKTSPNKSHRFIYDGEQYLIEVVKDGVWKKYTLNKLFDEYDIHLNLANVFWSKNDILFFYDFSKINRKTYSNVYSLEINNDQFVLNKSNSLIIEELEKSEHVTYEQILIERDIKKVAEALNETVDFDLNNNAINSITCGTEQHNFSMPLYFEAYFPDEHILLATSEGFNSYSLSTKTCGYASYPYYIHYAGNRNLRLSGLNLGEFASPTFFIESRNKTNNGYDYIFDISSLFTGHPDFEEDSFVWNGNKELLFFLKNSDEELTYYQITINDINAP